MIHAFSRFELGIGTENIQRLKQKTVAVLGIGGVGSYAVEALARSAIGRLILVDKDKVDITNINRQIHALHSTIGKPKVEVMRDRIKAINSECEVVPLHLFYNEHTADEIFSYDPDYIIDAIDTLSSKVHVILESKKRNIPIISSMGAANKLDPTQFIVTDISKTYMDPVAKFVRQQLKKHGIEKGVQVVFSPEKPLIPKKELFREVGKEESTIRKEKMPPSSNGFVPPMAGLIAASVVIRHFLELNKKGEKE
ncbi:tRNA threonylcarbamoyladenosine dehydratase [Tepidibacillus fermentans]|uniref:tRNA A37 threonylcarbamoyladenosine dehydratase n=1 Tax=Tepidibacillus fermentans TaxID=1281767 RepID=A0A4R3KJW2_9BACI|nr:tRNA threonylcarbamoyladenosine dehydratase [Tepidibacillus fermentans]TCS83822.1 tRNA A37 threonylcarbamoyladenosine dehydratase [Tepidibacillus fermentans]